MFEVSLSSLSDLEYNLILFDLNISFFLSISILLVELSEKLLYFDFSLLLIDNFDY